MDVLSSSTLRNLAKKDVAPAAIANSALALALMLAMAMMAMAVVPATNPAARSRRTPQLGRFFALKFTSIELDLKAVGGLQSVVCSSRID